MDTFLGFLDGVLVFFYLGFFRFIGCYFSCRVGVFGAANGDAVFNYSDFSRKMRVFFEIRF